MVSRAPPCSPHHQVATEGMASGSPSSFSQAPGRKPGSGGGLEQAAAERVGDQHIAGAHRLQQAGNAQRRVAAQFERVAEVVVEPAQDGVHAAQAVECLQVDAFATHRQVLPFDQREAEIAGEVGVFEVGFVVGARRQQHDQRRLVAVRCPMRQAVLQFAEERSQVLDVQVAELFGKEAADDGPVFERITGAGGACVRSAITHQRPSGERARSAA
jgi:hypothetical protein